MADYKILTVDNLISMLKDPNAKKVASQFDRGDLNQNDIKGTPYGSLFSVINNIKYMQNAGGLISAAEKSGKGDDPLTQQSIQQINDFNTNVKEWASSIPDLSNYQVGNYDATEQVRDYYNAGISNYGLGENFGGNPGPLRDMQEAYQDFGLGAGMGRPVETDKGLGLGGTLLSAAFGLATGGAGWLLPALLGGGIGGIDALTSDQNILGGTLKGALAGVGGKALGAKFGPSAYAAKTAPAAADIGSQLGTLETPSLSGSLTPASEGLTGGIGGIDLGGAQPQIGSSLANLGGNMPFDLNSLNLLLDAPSYLDQIGGLSLPPEVGGAGFDLNSLMNIGDYLGGGGGGSEIYPGVSGLSGILDPTSGTYGQSGLNITDILSNVGGAGGGIDLQKIYKTAQDVKKAYDSTQQGQQQSPTDQQPGGFDLNSLLQSLSGSMGGGAGVAGGAGGGTGRLPGVQYNVPQSPQFQSAGDIFDQATQRFGSPVPTPETFNAFDIIKPERISPDYFEQFQPTSLEEAITNKLFADNFEKAKRESTRIASQTGIANLAPSMFTKAIGPTITSIGEYLGNLGNQRAIQALNRESGLLNLGQQRGTQALGSQNQAFTNFANLATGQGNLQTQGDFQTAVAQAQEQMLREQSSAGERQAKSGLIGTGVGGVLGGLGANLFPNLGLNTGAGAALGAGLGGMVSPVFSSGGAQAPFSMQQAIQMANAINQSGKAQPVNQQNPFGGGGNSNDDFFKNNPFVILN